MSYYTTKFVYMLPIRYFDMRNDIKHGLRKISCCSWLVVTLVSKYLKQILILENVQMFISALLLTVTGVHFYAAAFISTVVAMVIAVFILPKLSCFEQRHLELPKEYAELRSQILAEFKKQGYKSEKVVLTLSRGGDLHGNAVVSGRQI